MVAAAGTRCHLYKFVHWTLRCSHCFLGAKLDEGTHFDFELLADLIDLAPDRADREDIRYNQNHYGGPGS